MTRRAKIAAGLGGLAAAGALAVPFGLTQGGGTIDVFVGSTPTATGGFTCAATISSGSNVGTAIAARSGGETLCLNSGTYSSGLSISSFNPSSTVTIRPAVGATVTMGGFTVTSSSHLTFTGFAAPSNFKGITITSSTDVELSHSTVDGGCPNGPASCGGVGLISLTNSATGANNRISYNTITGVSASSSSQEGSIQITSSTCASSAANPPVLIEHNLLDQGLTDGIQFGAECRTVIQYNVFQGKTEPSGAPCVGYPDGCPHVDSIQVVGDVTNLTVKGNYFRNDIDCWLSADGSTNNITYTDNVCVNTGGVSPIQAAGWVGGTFRHNTVVGTQDSKWDSTHASLNSSGLTGLDNILITGLSNGSQSGGGQWDTWDWSLTDCAPGNPCGSHIQDVLPTFVGGSSPSTWAGYALASGSNGENAASDGSDMGATFAVTPGP